jgi:hypothetical protein
MKRNENERMVPVIMEVEGGRVEEVSVRKTVVEMKVVMSRNSCVTV